MSARPRSVVLGASHWHRAQYRGALAEHTDIVAVQDPDPAWHARLDAEWDAPATASRDGALDLNPDLVLVLGRHDEMAASAHAVIDRGIPFLIEKPGAVTLDELEALVARAEREQVPAVVPLIQRGGPVEQWLARAGVPVYERVSFLAGPPERYRRVGNDWALEHEHAGGGCLTNLAPHFVDLFLQRAEGRADAALVSKSSLLHGEEVEDHGTIVVRTPRAEAIIEVGYCFPTSPQKRHCSYSTSGTEGFASIGPDGRSMFVGHDGHTEHAVIDLDTDPLYRRFVADAVRSLSEGFAGLPTLSDLLAAMRVIWS